METDSTTPDGGRSATPIFLSKPLAFRYRVIYTYQTRTDQIEYNSPLEVILNLRSFRDTDTITYINMDNGEDVFTMSIAEFKVSVGNTIINSSDDSIEALYIRLLITNNYSASIADSGYLKDLDRNLRKYLAKITTGVDHYLYGDHREVLMLKYRRLSINHLRSVILKKRDIQLYHINMPATIPNSWLFRDALNMSIPSTITRVYTFSPVSEDNIITAPIPGIPGRIIRIINTLIK